MVDPMDGITDVMFDAGGNWLMKHMEGRLAAAAAVKQEGANSGGSGQAEGAACGCSTTSGHVEAIGSRSGAPWSRMRNAVFGTAAFQMPSGTVAALRTQDDSCLCLASYSHGLSGSGGNAAASVSGGGGNGGGATSINPAHKAALSMLLSMMIGTLTSGAGPALATHTLDPFLHYSGPAIEAAVAAPSSSLAHASLGSFRVMAASSLRAAPSLTMAASSGLSASGAEGMFGAGGMAASTALKLLRAGERSYGCHSACSHRCRSDGERFLRAATCFVCCSDGERFLQPPAARAADNLSSWPITSSTHDASGPEPLTLPPALNLTLLTRPPACKS